MTLEPATRRCRWALPPAGAEPLPRGPLYPQLRARRNNLSRAEVIADQRARIHGAMVEAVVHHGYENATVATIARLAGVSTRTVYERFDSKEGCLLATCEVITRQAREKLSLASDAALGAGGHPLVSALAAFAQAIARHPKEASFILVHAPTAGERAYRQVAQAHALCAEALATRVEHAEGYKPSRQLLLGALHGVSHVARMCLVDGRAERAVELLPALQGWLLDCASPATADLWLGGPSSLVGLAGDSSSVGLAGGTSSVGPAGDSSLAGDVGDDAAARRLAARHAAGATAALKGGLSRNGERPSERLPRIAAEIAAREGYRSVSVARICDAAQIDVDEFLALFADPEDCLLAARELLSIEALASALRAIERQPQDLREWCDALRHALNALLVRIAEDPPLQSVGFLEPIGAEGVRRRIATMSRFADVLSKRARGVARFELVDGGGSPAPGFDPLLSDAVVGAFWGVVQQQVLQRQAQQLPSFVSPLTYLILCPIVGPELALETGLRADRAGVG
jgi:AcrR family transcriptional regulator